MENASEIVPFTLTTLWVGGRVESFYDVKQFWGYTNIFLECSGGSCGPESQMQRCRRRRVVGGIRVVAQLGF